MNRSTSTRDGARVMAGGQDVAPFHGLVFQLGRRCYPSTPGMFADAKRGPAATFRKIPTC